MDYVPIRLRTLVPNVPLTFDIYIKLSERYLLYVRSGDDIELQRLQRLQSKKVKQLFIPDDAETLYQKFLDHALIEAANNTQMTAVDRAATTADVASTAMEELHADPESLATFQRLEKAAQGIVQVIGKKTDVLKEFYTVNQDSSVDVLFQHAMNVASLASCLGEFLQFSMEELENLSIAAMLLDVGIVKMPSGAKRLFTTPYEEFTKEDWEIYRDHPKLGSEMLNGKTYINREILEIINDHEERKSGNGFPRGTTTTTKYLQIIGICECYDRIVTCLGKSHKEALDEIQINQLGNFDLELIKSFKKLLKIQGFANL